MSVNVTVPSLGESIVEAAIEKWQKKPGEWIAKGETIVTVESDKATLEVPSPASGILRKVLKADGASVKIGEVIGEIEEGEKPAAGAPAPAPSAPPPPAAAPTPAAPPAPAPAPAPAPTAGAPSGPAARRVMAEAGLDAGEVAGTGPGGRILKEDAVRAAEARPAPAAAAPSAPSAPTTVPTAPGGLPPTAAIHAGREEQSVPMTPLRRTIAERLVRAKQTTAMLTTFNEVDMSRVMALRAEHQPAFQKRYGIKLGFMSFFVKASIEALKAFPAVNAEIRGTDIVYKNYFDIGIAVGGGKGLTVPVIRNADMLSFAQTEQVIADFGARAQANKLKLEELQGGTFTITNGGIYGSMLSTPILNPPQSGILGMHNIVKRAVVVDDEIVIRPMMYLALSYDHRIVDGREAVQFLMRIKECLEAPERILLEV
ncbi:MAG TPA: 2-oxoglutarate dehydrogenase complex dihydrolipoyllysine-residue succinyltransferase [Vulgatibacter sp.]|nr:2-oxoglutarate dehydrogenase complex dihydrolipoyllysine-residue succinyltransferase [Vulgatibacter sp.]